MQLPVPETVRCPDCPTSLHHGTGGFVDCTPTRPTARHAPPCHNGVDALGFPASVFRAVMPSLLPCRVVWIVGRGTRVVVSLPANSEPATARCSRIERRGAVCICTAHRRWSYGCARVIGVSPFPPTPSHCVRDRCSTLWMRYLLSQPIPVAVWRVRRRRNTRPAAPLGIVVS